MDGVDLTPHLLGEAPLDTRRRLWLSSPRRTSEPDRSAPAGSGLGLRVGPWKLIRSRDRAELYNLERDAGERQNLAAREPDRVESLSALLDVWLERQKAKAPPSMPEVAPEHREGLRALGYAD